MNTVTGFLRDQWAYFAVGLAILMVAWYAIRTVAVILALVTPGRFLANYRRYRDAMSGWWHTHVVQHF
jgi:hypothetical protein